MFVSTNQFIYSLVVNFLPRWQPSFATERSKVRAGQEFLHRLKISHPFTSDLALNKFAHELGNTLPPARRFGIGPDCNRIIKGDGDVLHRQSPVPARPNPRKRVRSYRRTSSSSRSA